MNDDLNVILTMISKDEDRNMFKVAVRVEHGLNEFPEWMWFKEKAVQRQWEEILPIHVIGRGEIIHIEEIFEVIT